MLEEAAKSVARWIGKQFRYYRHKYNTHEKIFEAIGDYVGIIIFMALLGVGIAGIPFSGGASMAVPAWVFGLVYGSAALYFLCKFNNCYIVVGRAIGIIIDYFQGKRLPNRNEQLYTMLGLALGVVVAAILTTVLIMFAGPIVITLVQGTEMTIAPWVIALIDIPCIIGTITGYSRHRGRIRDREYKNTPIDTFNEIVFGAPPPPEPLDNAKPAERDEPELDVDKQIHADNISEVIVKAVAGINAYKTKRIGDNALGFFSTYFDFDTGERRANTYLQMLNLALNNFADDEKPDEYIHAEMIADTPEAHLQQAVILYTLIQNHEGDLLKDTVRSTLGYESVDQFEQALRKYIQEQVPSRARRENIKNNVIDKLGLFANSGKSFTSKNPEKYKDSENKIKPKYMADYIEMTTSLRALPGCKRTATRVI